MAFEIVNRAMLPFNAPAMPVRDYIADNTGDLGETDLGVAGFKHIRVRIKVKDGLTPGTSTFAFVVRVDNNASLASNEVVFSQPAITLAADEPWMTFDCSGWSQTGFRYYAIDTTTGGAGTGIWDAIVDAW